MQDWQSTGNHWKAVITIPIPFPLLNLNSLIINVKLPQYPISATLKILNFP